MARVSPVAVKEVLSGETVNVERLAGRGEAEEGGRGVMWTMYSSSRLFCWRQGVGSQPAVMVVVVELRNPKPVRGGGAEREGKRKYSGVQYSKVRSVIQLFATVKMVERQSLRKLIDTMYVH